MKADTRVAREVQSVIEKMMAGYRNRNLTEVMACFAPEPEVLLYVTGADEKRTGLDEIRAQVERDWSQTEHIELVIDSKAI